MAKEDEQVEQPILIRRYKKNPVGSHGGSWKIAYADFVTAMMAFFLLLWILAASTPEKKKNIAEYFKSVSVFSSGGGILQSEGELSNFLEAIPAESPSEARQKIILNTYKEIENALSADEAISDHVNLSVETTPEGKYIRIQVFDNKGSELFPSGSNRLNEEGRKIIGIIAKAVKDTELLLTVEGHTGSSPFEGENNITNWELSVVRASQARREFQEQGIAVSRFKEMAAYANRKPIYKENLTDIKNSRLCIKLSFPMLIDPSTAPKTGFHAVDETAGETP